MRTYHEKTKDELHKIISESSACIGYMPRRGEPEYEKSDIGTWCKNMVDVVPQTQNSDPLIIAKHFTMMHSARSVCVLVPGRQFDTYGTRHGHGGGWYDRFLAHVPKEWVRIGVIFEHALSKVELTRKAWDEPVDWIVVYDDVWRYRVLRCPPR